MLERSGREFSKRRQTSALTGTNGTFGSRFAKKAALRTLKNSRNGRTLDQSRVAPTQRVDGSCEPWIEPKGVPSDAMRYKRALCTTNCRHVDVSGEGRTEELCNGEQKKFDFFVAAISLLCGNFEP